MDRKQKQLPPILPGRDEAMSPRGYERENTSPRGYERGYNQENKSPRGYEIENTSPRGKERGYEIDNTSPRGRERGYERENTSPSGRERGYERENTSPRGKERGYDGENTSPRGYENYSRTKGDSPRGKDDSPRGKDNHYSPRGKDHMISPRLDMDNNRVSSRREKISPRLDLDGSVSPHMDRRGGARSPRLDRRDQTGGGAHMRSRKEDGGLLNNRRKGSDPRSPRSNGDQQNAFSVQEFRSLCIGSPIPNTGTEGEQGYRDNHRRHSSDKAATFPSIKVQTCEEEENGGVLNTSPRQKGEDQGHRGDGGRRMRARSPTPGQAKDPGPSKHRPRTIDASLPTSAQLDRTASNNSLLSPTTPPLQKKLGNTRFVVYNKNDPMEQGGKVHPLSPSSSEVNINDTVDREATKLKLQGMGDDRTSLPTSPRSDGALTPNPSPRWNARSPSPNRLSSSQGSTQSSPPSSPYHRRTRPVRLEPLNQKHTRRLSSD